MKLDRKTENSALEEELIIEKAKTNSQAFAPLYEKYYVIIFRFVLHRVGDKELSADICSQVFLKAITKLSSYKHKGLPFSAWLYRIAINECNDFFRRKKHARTIVLEENMAEGLFEEMFPYDVKNEMLSRLPFVLERLKEEELQLIEFRFFESRPFKEIAEILNISENYAKVKVYRVMDKMKKLMLPN